MVIRFGGGVNPTYLWTGINLKFSVILIDCVNRLFCDIILPNMVVALVFLFFFILRLKATDFV